MASTMDGTTVEAANIKGTSGVYDNNNRVFSNSNKPSVITTAIISNPNLNSSNNGYIIIPMTLNQNDSKGMYKVMICMGSFTSTSGGITFPKEFSQAPFVITSPNPSADMQSQRVAVNTVSATGFTTVSSGSYQGRYIAIGYLLEN